MPNTRSNATSEFLSLSNLKPKRKLAHDDSIRIAKKQKRCPVRRKKVDANNCSFSLDENDDIHDVTSVTDECDVAQAHKNFIEEISNATFVLDDGEQEQAHERVNLSLNMSLEMEEVGGNGNDLEFVNNPEDANVVIDKDNSEDC